MSNTCTNNITITGPDANKIYEKIKDATVVFGLFLPEPDIFEDWNAYDPTNITYTQVYDRGLKTEVRVEGCKVDAADLNKVLAENPYIQFLRNGCKVPIHYWNVRWRELNWEQECETYPTNIYFDENLGLLEFGCYTHYSPPSYFLQQLSNQYDVKISNAWEAEVCVGKELFEYGVKTEVAKYKLDVVEPEEKALVYSKEWLEMTDQEREDLYGELHKKPHDLYARQYKAEVVTFLQENGLFHYDKFAPVRKAATYYVKCAKGGAYHIGPDGKSVICFVTDSKRIGKDIFELEIRTLFGDNLGKFTVGGPNDQSELLTYVQ